MTRDRTRDSLRKNSKTAIAEARRVLGPGGVSITCGEGHSGFGWYAYVTEYPEEGSVKLDAPPLKPGITRLSPKLDPTKVRPGTSRSS